MIFYSTFRDYSGFWKWLIAYSYYDIQTLSVY